MDTVNEICPVCTLYLRPGITLKSHLNSHPKQKVIQALVNLANLKADKNCPTAATSEIEYQPQIVSRSSWNQPPTTFPGIPMPTANHSFIYQQFMSTSQPPCPQYVTIPTVFNSSMVCPPYVYQQQQQVFMSSSALPNLMRSKTPIIDQSPRQDVYEDQQKGIIDLDNNEEDNDDLSKKDGSVSEDCDEVASPAQLENDVEDKDENVPSPSGSDYLRVRQDLNKACQTRRESENFEDEQEADEDEDNESLNFYPQGDINIAQPNEQVLDMNGVQLVLCNDFIENPVISQVHDFDSNNGQPILLNLGMMECDAPTAVEENLTTEAFQDDGLSHQSGTNLSIRADENMPPRGELSGQESNGAMSDIVWNHIQCDSNSATSYDLFARETWNGSDGSDYEDLPPLQSRDSHRPAEMDDTPTIISVIEPPLNFKCPTCGKGFACQKERKLHQTEEHSKEIVAKSHKTGINLIGVNVPAKFRVKKLIIKPKRTLEVKNEANIEDQFHNKVRESERNSEKYSNDTMLIDAENKEDKCSVVEDKKKMSCFECSICGFLNSDMKSLVKHKQIVHFGSNRFKCDTCGEVMTSQQSFMEHLKKHPLECRLCGKYFYRRQNIQLHMKRHLGIKPFKCEFCEKPFFSKQKLHEHRNIHTGESPIKCSLCDETFRRHSNLVQHRNIHHFNMGKRVKDYICHCGEVLHSKKKLAWHKEIHDVKPKACSKCSEKFIHMSSLTRHMRRSHNDRFVPEETRSNENVECPICKNVYLKSSLEAHVRRHEGVKGYTCSICNKEFTTKWNLKLHKWVHASRASKPFKCEHCKSAFIRESEFIAHMNAHKSVRPYTCNHCGAQFIRKSNCQRHVKEHERDKTFTCQICGKAFHRSYYLKDHMRVHSGVRPFACHICGKTSATKSNHNKHIMIHHAKEPVSTEN